MRFRFLFAPSFHAHVRFLNPHSYQLAAVNPGIDSRCDNLEPGEDLCLGYVGSDCTTTHVVTSGETCDEVAQTYSMNTTVLYQNNPQLDVDCDNMYIGEVCFYRNTSHCP